MRSAAENIINSINRLRGFSPLGFLLYLSVKISNKEITVTGGCNGCGACCRSLCLDNGEGWIRHLKKFQKVVEEDDSFSCFKVIGRDSNGFLLFSCSHLGVDGKCLVYEHRFSFCRSFPDKNLLFCGGKLPSGCGYKFKIVKPFSKFLKKEIKGQSEKSSDT